MAAIAKLNIYKDTTGHSYGSSGQVLFTSTGSYLVSVIATNMAETDGVIYVYVVPSGTISTPDSWANIAYNLPLPAYNTYETFRFAMANNDALYIAGSAGMDYFVQGINQA